MSQGFHPRPKMTFPDALALGVEGKNEVLDIGLAEEVDPIALQERLRSQSPAGLVILDVRLLEPQERKVKVEQVRYEMSLPTDVLTLELQDAVAALTDKASLTVERNGKQVEINLKNTLDELRLDDHSLQMKIRITGQSQLQPRDILAFLGLQQLLQEGSILTRTQVELTT